MTYKELQKKHKLFVYDSFLYSKIEDKILVSYKYFLDQQEFVSNWEIPTPADFKITNLDNLLFHIGLVEMISYWKLACPKNIVIKAGKINNAQIKFLKDLILNGLGEFFYQNKINFLAKDFLTIKCDSNQVLEKFNFNLKEETLIGIGGGKDSIVALELLKETNPTCFAFGHKSSLDVIEISGSKGLIIKRKMDPKMGILNKQGYLNGHTPFSALLAFLGIFLGVIWAKKYIIVGNERSANEGNVKYLGKTINHQYSKTIDFENKFRKYYKEFIVGNVEYFSFLRPWHEIQIAKRFAEYKQYFSKFLSCNVGQANKTYKWCGKCAKCLFVYMMLYPFIDRNELINIFGNDLFADKTLIKIFKQLIGKEKIKPFDCVGTKTEAIASLALALDKNDGKLPYLLNYFDKNIKKPNKKSIDKLLNDFNKKNNVPEIFLKYLK
jgi:hypothetical protein